MADFEGFTSPGGDEFDANGRAYFGLFARGLQAAGLRIDAENNDGMRPLIVAEEKLALGIDGKISRRFASAGLVLDERDATGPGFDVVGRNAVVAAIGDVYEFAGRMNFDFRSRIAFHFGERQR